MKDAAPSPDTKMPKKLTFLDTNVLINAMCGETELAARCFAVIDDPDREFVVSDFLKLELLPKPVCFKQNESEAFYREYLSAASKMLETTPETTRRAFDLACLHGLGAIDAIHFQTAIEAEATEFITAEKQTKPYFKINHPSVVATSLR
jgi:predicted nucleic acid-binding protein